MADRHRHHQVELNLLLNRWPVTLFKQGELIRPRVIDQYIGLQTTLL